MIKLNQAVIVEGKYDKIKLENFIDALIITTRGFEIYKDREKLDLIRALAKTRGIVILTDSDAAGFQIRSYITGSVPRGNIINAFIPDIYGKERRKKIPSSENKLGVEGMEEKALLEALRKAGVLCENAPDNEAKTPFLTPAKLYEDGICGCRDSREKRLSLLWELSLPERLSAKDMIKIINRLYCREEYEAILQKISR